MADDGCQRRCLAANVLFLLPQLRTEGGKFALQRIESTGDPMIDGSTCLGDARSMAFAEPFGARPRQLTVACPPAADAASGRLVATLTGEVASLSLFEPLWSTVWVERTT